MDPAHSFVRVEQEGECDEEKEKGRQVLMPAPGVLIDSRRLPREDWVVVDEKHGSKRIKKFTWGC